MARPIYNRYCQSYYVLNVLLVLSYIPVRLWIGGVSLSRVDIYSFGLTKESQIIVVCLLVLSSKYRQSPTWDHFIANIFMFSKMALLTLCFILDKRLCVYYTILVILLFVLVKQPEHRIQDKTVLFSPEELHGTLGTNPHQVWLVYFYSVWASDCTTFSPVFSDLSNEFGTERLKFGKIDVGRHRRVAEIHNISVEVTTKQLPTIILFEKGKEIARLPVVADDGKVRRVLLSKGNVERYFTLSDRMAEAKKEEDEGKLGPRALKKLHRVAPVRSNKKKT